MFEQLHLLRPWWLLALIPLAIIWWRLWHSQALTNNWRKVCDPGLLPYLLVAQQSVRQRWPLYLLGVAWLATIIALSGPAWSRVTLPVYRSLHGTVIVFDLSPNMLATDVAPSRLDRAKFKLMDLLRNLPTNLVGLVAFSGEAYTVSPLTQDANTITAMVSQMSPFIMPVKGNNIAAGLTKGAELLKNGGAQQGNLILITSSTADMAAIAAAKHLAADGIHVEVLGIGTTEGAPIPLPGNGFLKDSAGNLLVAKLDPTSLQQLAAASDGEYIRFSETNADIQELATLSTHADAQAVQAGEARFLWQDQGRWLVILIVLLALLAFRRGWFEELTS